MTDSEIVERLLALGAEAWAQANVGVDSVKIGDLTISEEGVRSVYDSLRDRAASGEELWGLFVDLSIWKQDIEDQQCKAGVDDPPAGGGGGAVPALRGTGYLRDLGWGYHHGYGFVKRPNYARLGMRSTPLHQATADGLSLADETGMRGPIGKRRPARSDKPADKILKSQYKKERAARDARPDLTASEEAARRARIRQEEAALNAQYAEGVVRANAAFEQFLAGPNPKGVNRDEWFVYCAHRGGKTFADIGAELHVSDETARGIFKRAQASVPIALSKSNARAAFEMLFLMDGDDRGKEDKWSSFDEAAGNDNPVHDAHDDDQEETDLGDKD